MTRPLVSRCCRALQPPRNSQPSRLWCSDSSRNRARAMLAILIPGSRDGRSASATCVARFRPVTEPGAAFRRKHPRTGCIPASPAGRPRSHAIIDASTSRCGSFCPFYGRNGGYCASCTPISVVATSIYRLGIWGKVFDDDGFVPHWSSKVMTAQTVRHLADLVLLGAAPRAAPPFISRLG